MIKAARRQHSGFTSFIIVIRKRPEQGELRSFCVFWDLYSALSDASWTGANVIIAILDGDMDPETAGAYGVTRNEYLRIYEMASGRR